MHHTTNLVAFLTAAGLGFASGSPLAAAPPQPDLIVFELVAPPVAAAGADIGPQIRLTVKNVGRAVAPGTDAHPSGYMVDLTLGRVEPVPPGFHAYSPNYAEDVLLKGGRVSRTGDLAPNALRAYQVGAGIPADTPLGDYFLCATVDPGAAVPEMNDGNNTKCRRIRIQPRLNVGPQEDLPIKPK